MSGKIRRNFSHHELSVATATGYIRSIDRFYRPKIRGYPIDDHDPERATDRDDAVYAEAIPGGYLLHVTIADVAAHIPKDSSLDKAALSRAFTIYRPPARDPMFPFVLSEDRFSLEHEQERLGVTATIELDQGFQPVDIRFSRTVITSECHDYATASRRMGMEGDDFELLARIAKGVKETYRPPIHPYGSSDTAYMDKTGLLRRGEAGAMAAAKLVQVMMIFANNEIAKFFTRTGLPFLYRNHAHDGENQGRAEYEPYDRGHYALRSEGLRGAYSHCTSPIRRYADLVNQRMMHYCMDVASSIAGELAGFFPEEERRTKHSLQPLVWEHLEGILADNFKVQQAFGRARMEAEKQLQLKLKAVLRDVFPNAKDALYQQGDPVAQLVSAVVRLPVPYSHEELSAITPSLNSAHVEEREAITELNRRNMVKWNEKAQDDLAAGHFDALSESAFSGVLRRAAVTGRINAEFAREAARRFREGEVDMVPDAYSVLVLNKEYQNVYWRALKRSSLNLIERDPMVINNLIEKGMKEHEIHPDTYVAEAVVRDSVAEEAMPLLRAAGIEQHIDAALVVTYLDDMGDREYAAEDYSVGYTKKDTVRHARFNFVRALAFGELGPVDQTILPTPLFAELSHDRSRAKILREMAESMGLTIREFGPRERLDGKYNFAYQVYGPGIEHSILGFVVGASHDRVREKSATRILRSTQFKRAYATQHPVEIGFPSNPIYVIRELANANGWKLSEPERNEIEEIERGVFRAEIVLEIAKGDVLEASCEARNKDNALQFGFERLREKLKARDLLPTEEKERAAQGGGWITWSAATRDQFATH